MTAIVLAAGYATRLYPLTLDLPKALLPLGGRAMLDYLMDQIASVDDVRDVVIVTNSRFYNQFLAWLDQARFEGRYPDLNLQVLDDGTHSDETKRGAVGDMLYAIETLCIDDELLVCASDNFFTFPLTDFVQDFHRTGKDTLLMAHLDSVATLRGFAVATLDDQGRVIGFVEKPKDPPTDIGVYALYLYKRDTVPLIRQYLDEGNSPDAPGHFPEWLYHRRDVRGYLFEGECIDIGTPEMYKTVCDRFIEGGDLHNG